jgi:hypothetical protein
MDFTTLLTKMPAILDLSLTDRRLAVELQSAPGRGKSEFIASLIQSQSARTGVPWGFATCFLATQSPSDMLGFMIPQAMSDGRARSTFTMPAWYQTVDGKTVEDYPRGILLLDEYGQGESDVKRSSAELLLNGRLGPWQLPKGWTVIACSNRANDRSGVTKSFDFVINRRLEIHVTDSIEAWKTWALTRGVHPIVVHFADQNPQIVFADGVPEKQGPWCTPRSLVMACDLLEAMRPEGMAPDVLPSDGSALQLVSGLIGEPAAAQLFATVRLAGEMPTFDEIVGDPEGVKAPTKADACYLLAYQIAHRVDPKSIAAAITYIGRLPKEFGFLFAKAMSLRAPALVASPPFGKWAAANAALVNAISRV